MATKLGLFNAALIEIGQNVAADTGEPVEAPRLLAAVYDDVVAECIAEASWNFAMETVRLDADTGVTPAFGYTEVFAKPTDWVRTVGVSQDEYFYYPEIHYYDDSNYLSADNSPLYVRYVSSDTGLGLDLTRWPAQFSRYVALVLADRIARRVTDDEQLLLRVEQEKEKQKKLAKNTDAMNEPNPKFAPPGSWTSSRWGRLSRGDRGSRGNLTE